jgi:phosphoenolpyruvate synthase/pyruvate phosphate dikinase
MLEEKYGCVPYGYGGPTVWDIDYYFGKIGELIGTDEVELKGRIFELESYADEISKRHSEIEGTLGLSQEEIRLCGALRTLAIMADQKKEFQFRCHVALGKVLNEMANKLGVSESSLRYVFPEEIEKLRSNPEEISKIAQRRMQKMFVVEFKRGKYKVIEGDEAEALRSILPKEEKGDVLKGEVGSLGLSQVTRGKARVLLSTKDVHVLEEGEILVATMTTPDYVVAMKKASAIVTDEGGVTCHAAIVARELGIPCVIATHSATRRIRTGDEIEVDVGTGEVRIIKRA